MARAIEWVKRPAPETADRAADNHPRVAIGLALAGVVAVLIAAVGHLDAADTLAADAAGAAATKAWTFALTVAGFGTVKAAIAIVLIGILARLWIRVDSVSAALTTLTGSGGTPTRAGPFDSDYGAGQATAEPPEALTIHRMARTMWLPALVMGVMALAAGLVAGFVAADATGESLRQASAWSQGLTFLGETFLLSGISFLLGTILAGLREGGGEVQAAAGVTVKTVDMPASAKAFIALMATGMMIGIVQFALYVNLATIASDAAAFAGWAAWLGPLREAGLGVLLSGIVLALYTISKILGFQFSRIRQIIATGA